MRLLLLAPLAAIAACGGETQEKAKAPERAQTMQAGQWQSSVEVTNLRKLDQGEPRLNLPAGTRLSGGACVGSADGARPTPELFAGSDFESCRHGENFYMRNGRMISSMSCRRPGVGEVVVTVNVDFTATGFDGTVEYTTHLPTDGDVHIGARLSGRRTGDCAPGAEGGNQSRPG